ncbi:MAG: hypothetical protein JWN27_2926 [Candidatus Eremiobacteraeota bacterium]|nr:hypothetical protein [Candidatus Eremiobacteraeota bacterium]
MPSDRETTAADEAALIREARKLPRHENRLSAFRIAHDLADALEAALGAASLATDDERGELAELIYDLRPGVMPPWEGREDAARAKLSQAIADAILAAGYRRPASPVVTECFAVSCDYPRCFETFEVAWQPRGDVRLYCPKHASPVVTLDEEDVKAIAHAAHILGPRSRVRLRNIIARSSKPEENHA